VLKDQVKGSWEFEEFPRALTDREHAELWNGGYGFMTRRGRWWGRIVPQWLNCWLFKRKYR